VGISVALLGRFQTHYQVREAIEDCYPCQTISSGSSEISRTGGKNYFCYELKIIRNTATDLPTNVVPIKVDYSSIGYGYFYPLDMHQNKLGHQEIAKQVLEQMKQHAEGRACLSAQ
jgi:hypothetical protein